MLAFWTFDQSDEETWPDKSKHSEKDKDEINNEEKDKCNKLENQDEIQNVSLRHLKSLGTLWAPTSSWREGASRRTEKHILVLGYPSETWDNAKAALI